MENIFSQTMKNIRLLSGLNSADNKEETLFTEKITVSNLTGAQRALLLDILSNIQSGSIGEGSDFNGQYIDVALEY